ncbi:hypothetical protein Osc7112_2888 [Oscillatoria nigro-viridis PCC 7112]|uniref:Uncharacterized protein n=1 Tax=Phormidium nigroviride PCC 7112 TaxID=179408 RepID=K9VGR0_9CYAN|nr:hypothetical protein [Oscillatoria nigro-viridis]AFZ07288.1 hypothetical protein Osc7112_2888 [Oscillatoria nigro-viridis PCC 7112]
MQLLRKRDREGFMVDAKSLQSDGFAEFDTACRSKDLNGKKSFVATPERSGAGSDVRSRATVPAIVRVALEDLKCFEVVEHQFAHWGVTFSNAVAIQPSNPSFFTGSGATVLMGAPKSGLIEVTFKYPVRWVSGLVTSSRRTVLSACDIDGNPIVQDEMPAPNLVGSNSPIAPRAPLRVKAPNIYRITFYAFDGQLVVDDLMFGF